MDKYSDPTAAREPLFTDVASAVIGKRDVEMIGSSYGISSKDFAPLHVEAIIKNLVKPHTVNHFTIASPETAFPIGKPEIHLLGPWFRCYSQRKQVGNQAYRL